MIIRPLSLAVGFLGLAGCAIPWLEAQEPPSVAAGKAEIRAPILNIDTAPPPGSLEKASIEKGATQEGGTQEGVRQAGGTDEGSSPLAGPEPGIDAEAAHGARVIIVSRSGARHNFSVELADDLESQRRGLMFRRELATSSGMLFDFGKSRPVNMWMKNTYIPLDILFIAEDGRIVNIEANTVPHSLKRLSSNGAVKAALEINAGLSQSLGIRPGDRLIHPIFR